ncbi:unnamed protein product [Leptidea sinapis]|uniref:Uncharacterized protein n=1 Tax=Leptidea sinapis TaxID=189913 RepID=A0A5E4QAF4_9NEOP|nr:unnamed protein product [Leptidea sinapis]
MSIACCNWVTVARSSLVHVLAKTWTQRPKCDEDVVFYIRAVDYLIVDYAVKCACVSEKPYS